MNKAVLVSYFFGGACLTNAIPHLVSGLTGRSFPSLFTKPVGVGLSSPTVNFLWGWSNLVFGCVLLMRVGEFKMRSNVDVPCALLGSLLIGLSLAQQFGKLYGTKS
jgi:hypothetical protein